jgi:tRNA A-37 threonylcarbamoyl transferase component Bud32
MQSEMQLYTKLVNEKEILFTLIASNEGISPKLISWKRDNGKYIIKSEQYLGMLMDEPVRTFYKEDGVKLVRKLHSLGIFHADITEENFVVNPITGEMKMIDFGLSCWIDDITEKQMKNTYYEPASSVNHLLELEIREIEWLCNQRKM